MRSTWLAAPLVLGLMVAAPTGVALAEDEPSASPSPTPSATPSTTPTSSPTTPPPVNQAPVTKHDTATVTAGKRVTVSVLANDTDDGLGGPEGSTPKLEVVSVKGAGDMGRSSFKPDSVTFEAHGDSRGKVKLTYKVSDGELKSTGTVTVTVKPLPRSVSIHLPDKLVALNNYRVKGRVKPETGQPLTVRVQRLVGDGRWQDFAQDLTDAEGRYVVGYRPVRAQKQTFRAVADWSEKIHTRSDRLTRSVRAEANVKVSGPLARRQVPYSWRSGCPVAPSGLRKISINGFDYSGRIHRGAVVVGSTHVGAVVRVLRSAFGQRFPIRSMRPADYFYKGGSRTPSQSDVAAMRADNTSAFNCRPVTGNPYRISQHSYGNAIDINTVRNPYVTGSRVYPSWARTYLDRSNRRAGMILRGGVVANQMSRLGWLWGARWSHPDYQHFSSNGG